MNNIIFAILIEKCEKKAFFRDSSFLKFILFFENLKSFKIAR